MVTVDSNGIAWMCATGAQGVIAQSRDEADDDRWSGNVTGVARGYETTMIAKSIGIASDGHFASKLFGGNHSGSGASTQRWYDLGVRENGDVQLQWEGPHPSNHDFDLPAAKNPITNIGTGLEGVWVGLKWLVYKKIAGGSPENGGVRCVMWVNTSIASDGKPNNAAWRLCIDFIDGVDVEVIDPQDFEAPDECDLEIRRSGTEDHDIYAGGEHWRKLSASDIAAFESGTTTPPPPPPPPPTGTNIDPLGVKMIYPTKEFGQTWFQNDNPEFDGRLISGQEVITRTGDYFVASSSTVPGEVGSVTLTVVTDFGDLGALPCDPQDTNFSNLASQGNVYTSDDWRNVEITCVVFPQTLDTNAGEIADFDWSFQARATIGAISAPVGCCGIFRYSAVLRMTNTGTHIGNVNFNKTLGGGNQIPLAAVLPTIKPSFYRSWTGVKFIVYNTVGPNNEEWVTLELWLCPSDSATDLLSNWTKVASTIDKGDNWGSGGENCGGSDKQAITWGTPGINMNYNNMPELRWKKWSVREIDLNAEFPGDPDDPPDDPCDDVVVPPPPPVTTEPLTYRFLSKFGSQGSGNGQFVDPHDIAIDSSGNLFVCDPGRQDIQKFTSAGVYVSKFGSGGSGTGQFDFNYGIAIDSNNEIFVADSQGFKIMKFSSAGTHIRTVTSVPASPSDLDSPEAIAFDPVTDDVYVCDARKERILKFDNDLNFILAWGSQGTGNNQFDHPHGIAVDSDRNVYVVQSGYADVKVYDRNGTFIRKWGVSGTSTGQLLPPLEHMDIDSQNRLYIVNNDVRPLIQVFDTLGHYITKFGSETPGSGDGQFREPENCRIGPNGLAYVVDRENWRVQVFEPVGGTTPPPPPTTTGPVPLYRFISWGDNDTTTDATDVLDRIFLETNVSQYLFAGDGPYSSSGDNWVDMMSQYFSTTALKNMLMLAQGNHEHTESESQTTEDDIEAWFPGLNNPVEGLEWLQQKKVGNAYIIVMNSQDPNIDEQGGDQFNYVQNALNTAKSLRTAGQIDWIIAMVHKSWFNLLGSNPAYVTARHTYAAMFRNAQVDFMFHGHNHSYAIWKPIIDIAGDDENTSAQPLFTMAADGVRYDFSKDHGAFYIINGNGGHEINSWGEDPADFPNILYANDTVYGYSVLDIQGKQATLTAKNASGTVLYSVRATRGIDSVTDPDPIPPADPDPCAPPPPPPPPESVFNDLTIVYNINSDSDGCLCNDPGFTPPPTGTEPCPTGQVRNTTTGLCESIVNPPPPPPGGGGSGGENTAIYNIGYSGPGPDDLRMASEGDDEHFYLAVGAEITGTSSPLYNKNIKRIEWPLRKSGNPTGDATVVIRKGSDNSIAKTLGTIPVSDLTNNTEYKPVENTSTTYNIVVGDRILIEYDGGDDNDYVIAWAVNSLSNSTRLTKRDNSMDDDEYRSRDQEASFRAFA